MTIEQFETKILDMRISLSAANDLHDRGYWSDGQYVENVQRMAGTLVRACRDAMVEITKGTDGINNDEAI